jgi:hypothetical protein
MKAEPANQVRPRPSIDDPLTRSAPSTRQEPTLTFDKAALNNETRVDVGNA